MERLRNMLEKARIIPELIRLLPAGQPCYLVGGALRDWLLGRCAADFDFTTPDDPTPLAKRWADATGGRWFMLDDERSYSRVVLRSAAGVLTYDFTPFRGSDLLADLALRDFTINALALCLSPASADWRLLDPLGGAADLTARRLRPCAVENLASDPLRVIKGVRHAVTLDLSIEPTVAGALRAAAAGLTKIPGERILAELAAVLREGPARTALSPLFELEIWPAVCGVPDSPGGAETALALAERIDEVFVEVSLPEPADGETFSDLPLGDGLTRLAMLRLAAAVRSCGELCPEALATRLCLSRSNRRRLMSLATLAEARGRELVELSCSGRGLAQWAATLGPFPAEALLLLAAFNPPPQMPRNHLSATLAALRRYSHDGRIPDLVDGDWVRRHLHLSQGADVGNCLVLLRREEIAGRVNTAEEGRKFLISLKEKMIDNQRGEPL